MDFEGIYCFDTASVRLAVYPDGPKGARVVAQISEDTLHDGFGTREVGHRLLDVCRNNFHAIEPGRRALPGQSAAARGHADAHRLCDGQRGAPAVRR
jgi:hypothetical protein